MGFIIVDEWILRHPELSRFEALFISEIIRWPNGCHKSSQSLAVMFKSDYRTIQRLIRGLVKKQWLAVLYTDKQVRILYATPKDPPLGPLFEYKAKADKAIQKHNINLFSELKKQVADKMSI